eukprot:gene18675-21733_t
MSNTPLLKAVRTGEQAEVERILALSTADLEKIHIAPLIKAVCAKDQAEVERILAVSTADLDKKDE